MGEIFLPKNNLYLTSNSIVNMAAARTIARRRRTVELVVLVRGHPISTVTGVSMHFFPFQRAMTDRAPLRRLLLLLTTLLPSNLISLSHPRPGSISDPHYQARQFSFNAPASCRLQLQLLSSSSSNADGHCMWGWRKGKPASQYGDTCVTST